MEYTMEWNNRMYYPIAVKYDGMLIGILSREALGWPSMLSASMCNDYGSDKAIELEAGKEEKSWGLNPELAAKAIWKYHLKHMSWKKRLRRRWKQIKAIWAFWLAIGMLLLSSDFSNVPANIDAVFQFMDIWE